MKKRILILAGILSLTMATPAFAGATNSFSVGESDIPSKDSPTGYIDTSENALDVARNLVYAGYTPIIAIENVGRNAVTADRLNSGVDFLAGHVMKILFIGNRSVLRTIQRALNTPILVI